MYSIKNIFPYPIWVSQKNSKLYYISGRLTRENFRLYQIYALITWSQVDDALMAMPYESRHEESDSPPEWTF